jgi:hypothetical protein
MSSRRPVREEQELVHVQLDLAADLQRGGQEHVERGLDGALPRVLHRHHAEVGVPGFDFLEHLLDAGQRQAARGMAEVLEQRLLREGAFGAEVADLQRLLLRQAGRHDFAEQAQQHFVGQRAVVAVEHLAQHLRLALGPVVVDRGLERPLALPTRAPSSARSAITPDLASMPSMPRAPRAPARAGAPGSARCARFARGRLRAGMRQPLRRWKSAMKSPAPARRRAAWRCRSRRACRPSARWPFRPSRPAARLP